MIQKLTVEEKLKIRNGRFIRYFSHDQIPFSTTDIEEIDDMIDRNQRMLSGKAPLYLMGRYVVTSRNPTYDDYN